MKILNQTEREALKRSDCQENIRWTNIERIFFGGDVNINEKRFEKKELNSLDGSSEIKETRSINDLNFFWKDATPFDRRRLEAIKMATRSTPWMLGLLLHPQRAELRTPEDKLEKTISTFTGDDLALAYICLNIWTCSGAAVYWESQITDKDVFHDVQLANKFLRNYF